MSNVKSDTDPKKTTPRKTSEKAGTARKKSPATAAATAPAVRSAPAAPPQLLRTAAPAVRRPAAEAEPEMVVLDPTHEEIALRAYELYRARGRREGNPDADWIRAEQELRVERERARIALRQASRRTTPES